jgi:hypothetical protein
MEMAAQETSLYMTVLMTPVMANVAGIPGYKAAVR